MRCTIVLFSFLVVATSVDALGRMVQPDGSVVALAEAPSTVGDAVLFSPRLLPQRSWMTLPAGSTVSEVEITAPGYRERISFPTVEIPGVRYAVEVPARAFSLGLRGRWGPGKTLERTLVRPGSPGEAWVIRSANDLVVDLPEWRTAEGFTGVLTLTRPVASAWQVNFSNAKEQQTFTFRPAVASFDFSPTAWGFVPTQVEVRGPKPELADVRVRALGAEATLPADPETLLRWPADAWREPRREWFAWTGTSVLVLITADYRVQDDYLKRLAFYVEKTGYRGRLVPEADLATLHGWNAHDYAAPDLARFYSQAAAELYQPNQKNGEESSGRDRGQYLGYWLDDARQIGVEANRYANGDCP